MISYRPPARAPCQAAVRLGCPLLFFANLLAQIPLVTDFLDLVELGLQPIDVALFVFQQALEELARCVVTLIPRDLDRFVVGGDSAGFQSQIALKLLLHIAADSEVQQLGQIRRTIQKEDALDDGFGVFSSRRWTAS